MARDTFVLKTRAKILDALAEGFSISHACREAGYSGEAFHNRLRINPELKVLVDDAVDRGTEHLEDEARRRAFHGTEEPVFQGGHQVGKIRKYSDTLLIFLLKGRNPGKYKDRMDLSNPDGSNIMAPLAAAIRNAAAGGKP